MIVRKFSALPLQIFIKWGRLLLPLLIVFLFCGLYPKTVQAQENIASPALETVKTNSYSAPNTNSDVPRNLHTYSQNVLIEVMAAVACQLSGIDPTTSDGRCLSPDPKTGKIGYAQKGGGAVGFMSNMITMLYTPPAHTSQYIQSLAQNFGISKKAYARIIFEDGDNTGSLPDTTTNTGFSALSPIMNIWTAFRNIAYLLFVLVFVIIGVAIMLRLKIDPRTVMTIQNQIPKIIIGILLVTFSFAIAGFLIDVMWIAIYLFYNVFQGIPGVDVASLTPQHLVGLSPLGAAGSLGGIGHIAWDGGGAVKDIFTNSLLDSPGGTLIGKILGGIIGAGVGGAASGIVGKLGGIIGGGIGAAAGGGPNPITAAIGKQLGEVVAVAGAGALGFGVGGTGIGKSILGTLGGLIAFLIIYIALLWALIRVWFVLLMAYIMILLDIVFAPFWVIGSIIPGSKVSFTGWLRSMLGNLAAFPATLVMFLLGKTFMDTFTSNTAGQFVPPFIGNPGDTKSFGAIIGLGIILTIPGVVKMMRSVFGTPQFELSSIGAAIGVGAGVPMGMARSVASYYHEPVPGGGKAGFGGLLRNMLKF